MKVPKGWIDRSGESEDTRAPSEVADGLVAAPDDTGVTTAVLTIEQR